MLWERFREAGLRLESAGTSLASAVGPSSLKIVGFASKLDEETSESRSPSSKRTSRRPDSFDGTKTGTGALPPVTVVSAGEETGSLSACIGFGDVELI